MNTRAIVWFRQDLRLSDNPALLTAVNSGFELLPIYILDDENAGAFKMGAASRVWLHHSLKSLNGALNGKLQCYAGDASDILVALANEENAQLVVWNRCYEPWRIERDKKVKELLQNKGVTVETCNASLLWEPWTIRKKDGTPYKVFTPYYKKGCLGADAPRAPIKSPKLLPLFSAALTGRKVKQVSIDQMRLLPDSLAWHKDMMSYWQVGEKAAQGKVNAFIRGPITAYKTMRDFPAEGYGSRLSPHLHFGEVSPHQVWHAARAAPLMEDESNRAHFLSELAWREFSYYLLYHWPSLPTEPFQAKYRLFPWYQSNDTLESWKRGKTGFPIVDAGMRELWQTGYMHNRVRMIVASFLVKNQLTHWREGAEWFWDCLLDADLASNSASWQWVAGCGADAAPYFRIFNPVTQSKKFDPEGKYIRRYCPELSRLPNKYFFAPWEASETVLQAAGVCLGKNYPHPIVDLKLTRARALAANQLIKNQA